MNGVTLSGNTAVNGGGVFNTGTVVVTDSTIAGNSATNGGGLYNEGTATLTACTISGNSATDSGGGLYNQPMLRTLPGIATLTDTIVAGNTGPAAPMISAAARPARSPARTT